MFPSIRFLVALKKYFNNTDLGHLAKYRTSYVERSYRICSITFNSYSANRGISRDDIHCALALTAAIAAMHRLVRQC